MGMMLSDVVSSEIASGSEVRRASPLARVKPQPRPGPSVPRCGIRSACQSPSRPTMKRVLSPNVSLYGEPATELSTRGLYAPKRISTAPDCGEPSRVVLGPYAPNSSTPRTVCAEATLDQPSKPRVETSNNRFTSRV